MSAVNTEGGAILQNAAAASPQPCTVPPDTPEMMTMTDAASAAGGENGAAVTDTRQRPE